MINAADLIGAKRTDLERLARYLGVRVWANDDNYGLALRIAQALRRIHAEA